MKIITVPTLFWDDHADRCASYKKCIWKEIKRTQKLITLAVNDEELHNLKSDAAYYAEAKLRDVEYSASFRNSARITLERLKGK